jgi:nucleotide-binding universal stress UspA family protein
MDEGPVRRPRILLAHDLSPAADRAAAVIAGTTWPDGTVVRVVSSPIGIGAGASSFAMLSEARVQLRQLHARIESALERLAGDLVDAGVTTETAIVHGRPERALIADADRFGADLVVVGARDRGPIAATILGSVSRAVVESAPCSVLVIRRRAVSRVLVATDESAPARLATTMVASWPLFAAAAVLVVEVADAAARRPGAAVDLAVAELATRDRSLEHEIRRGDPGTEIVAAARSWDPDLVAVGANGEPLLRRLILGGVARKVIDGLPASVLVARPRRPERGD